MVSLQCQRCHHLHLIHRKILTDAVSKGKKTKQYKNYKEIIKHSAEQNERKATRKGGLCNFKLGKD